MKGLVDQEMGLSERTMLLVFCKHSIISKHIRTAELVYNHINEHKHFHALESSRHFGPMVFYLCWNRQVQKSELTYDTNLASGIFGVINKVPKIFQY